MAQTRTSRQPPGRFYDVLKVRLLRYFLRCPEGHYVRPSTMCWRLTATCCSLRK